MQNRFAKYAQPSAGIPTFQVPQSSEQIAEEQRKQAAEARAQQDQALQMGAAGRDATRLDLAVASDARAAAKDAEGTEAERTAAFLATRVKGGINDLSTLGEKGYPSLATESVGRAPLVGNYIVGGDVQQRRAAEMDILDAALTLGTGAAYTKEQLEGYRESYFPRPGDSPETLASKQQRLFRMLEAAKVKAGRSAPMIDEALALARGGAGNGDEGFRKGIEDRIKAGETPGAIIKWLQDSGRPPTPEQIDRIVANYGNRNPTVLPPEGAGPFDGSGRALALGVGDVVEGAGDIVGLVGNPLNAGINAVAGTNLSTDMGQLFRDSLGLPEARTGTEQAISAFSQGATGALGLGGLARGGARLATGALENALARAGSAPAVDAVTGGTGALAGDIVRQSGVGPLGQIAATLAGGAFALPAGMRVNALLDPPPMGTSPVQTAGAAEGVNVNRVMVDASLQNRATGVEATMAGGPMMQSGMRKVGEQIEAGVQRLGRGGTAMEPNVAGDSIRNASTRYIRESGRKARVRYDRAEKAAGDAVVPAQEAGQEVGAIITRLSETPNTNSAEIAYLKGLEEDIGKGLSVGALRDLRTTLRQRISKGELTFGQNEARVLGIMDAISRDIENGLRAQGKEGAARLFRQADTEYAERMQFITGTIQKLIGRRNGNFTPERVFNTFKGMATPRGDAAGLARMLREMSPEEQADIAATFAEALGRNNRGEFSTAHLLSQAEKLPAAAKVNLFGQEGAKSLDRLVTLANEHARVTSKFNPSRTGAANDWRSWVFNLFFGGGAGVASGDVLTGAAAAVAGMGVKSGRDVLAARSLLSTDLTNWLRTAPRTTSPKAINTHYDRLATIAARNPALQSDIARLQQMIMEAANNNAGMVNRSVAGDNETERKN